MNLALNSLVWRAALRAVPESHRSEVLGTLTECYGPKAPLSEAFRTFTSGSRMNNRLEAGSPVDLWRHAARHAVVFATVFGGTQTLGYALLPPREGYMSRFWPGLVLAAVTGIFAVLFLRGRCTKTFIGITLASQTLQFAVGAYQQQKDHRYGVSWSLWTAQGILVLSCLAVWYFRHSVRKVCLMVCAATITLAVSKWLLPRVDQNEMLRSRNLYVLFAYSEALGSLALFTLATLASGSAPYANLKLRWWPFALSFGLALSLSLAQSDWVPERWTSPINRLLAVLVIGLLALSVFVAMARPQLVLAFGLVYFIEMARMALIETDSSVPLAPVLIALTTALVGWQAAKRSLVT